MSALTPARLVCRPASIRVRGPKRPSTGELWLELGSTGFPHEGWDDFAVVIAVAWMEALRGLVDGPQTVHFMDGPFSVALARVGPGVLRLVAVDHTRDATSPVLVSESELRTSIHQAARAIASECGVQGEMSWDLDRLCAALAAVGL